MNPDPDPTPTEDEPTPAERAERLIEAANRHREQQRELTLRHFTSWL
jgi:hypothetical protein